MDSKNTNENQFIKNNRNEESTQPLLQEMNHEDIVNQFEDIKEERKRQESIQSESSDDQSSPLKEGQDLGQFRTDSEISDGTQQRFRQFEVNKVWQKNEKAQKFKSNQISTAKYNVITFLPKNLFYQFMKFSNVYFLLMAMLELIPAISDAGGKPVMLMPLLFVILVSMVKDIFEDYKRHVSDNQENRKKTLEGNPQTMAFDQKKWEEIQVGRILKINCDQQFPADLILLNSSGVKGVCYIETKNLDGETNLKFRQSLKETCQISNNDMQVMKNLTGAKVECENPNEVLYSFQGKITIKGETYPLCLDQLLLRGSSLKNTEWAYGIVVFTGHETKIMKNSIPSKAKLSKLERATNKYILLMVVLQIIICLVASLTSSIWTILNYYNFWYLEIELNQIFIVMFLTSFGTWFIMFMNLVPISLMVTLEVVKFIQATFIQWDYQIYDETKDMETKVQSSNLNEELGMIHYIFSDKTGTLTQNVMEFKKFTAGKQSYGVSNPPKMVNKEGVTNVNFYDQQFDSHYSDKMNPNYPYIRKFIELLGVCHTVVVEEKHGVMSYNASSPDELAFVNAAMQFGFKFTGRDEDNNVIIEEENGMVLKYKLLNVIEFTSARKRMTVVVQTPDNKIKVLIKGADSIIIPLLKKGQKNLDQTIINLEQYAKEGLRTLIIGEKEIAQDFYEQWNQIHKTALTALQNREKHIDEVAARIENEFELIGATAIEDKLQEDVADTIAFIKQAGIKVWVLTGDKIETALNIGLSCALLNSDMETFIIDGKASKDIMLQITSHIRDQKLTENVRQNAVIVAGESLTKITKNERAREEFLELALKASVVLCCRVSPKQKGQVVEMVRRKVPTSTTLAIGDGANDVNMIVAAHIGIGILGLEGQQAARASDYAIGQFRFLKNLLFVHGREAYRRNSYLIAYMFYKNVIFVLPIFWFGIVSVFSGTAMYDPVLYQFYNLFFTSIPVIWFAIYDYEFEKDEFMKSHKYYKLGFRNEEFNSFVFWRWMFYATWQSCIVLFLCFYSMDNTSDDDGMLGSLYVDGQYVFLTVVTLVNIKILTSTNNHNVFMFILIFASIFVYIVFYWIVTLVPSDEMYGEFKDLYLHGNFGFALFFMAVSLVMVDIGLHHAQRGISTIIEIREQEEEEKKKQAIAKDHTYLKRRVTTFSHRGYAFSGEAGNDPIIMDSLSKKFKFMINGQKKLKNNAEVSFHNKVAPQNKELFTSIQEEQNDEEETSYINGRNTNYQEGFDQKEIQELQNEINKHDYD